MQEGLGEHFLRKQDGVLYVGHASALVGISGKLFLFDPMWDHSPYGDYWFFFPEQVNLDHLLPEVDGCFISHIHEDHVCLRILEQLVCPIYIMSGRPNLRDRLKKCKNVIEVNKLEWLEVNKDTSMYFVPHSFNTIDSSVFLSSDDYCVYVGNDNFLSKDLIDRVKPDIGSVDVAMVPYAFIHWYPHLLKNITNEERQSETDKLNKQSLDQALMFMEAFKPKYTIPFGASLFYSGGEGHILNRSLLTPYDLPGALSLLAKDYLMDDGSHSPLREKEVYKMLLNMEESENVFQPKDEAIIVGPEDLKRIQDKAIKSGTCVEDHELIINDIIFIDLERADVQYYTFKRKNKTKFYFKNHEFNKWLKGEITFEQAIGTRRFYMLRDPNVYNLKVFEWFNNYL